MGCRSLNKILMALSVLIKPNFALVFLPAASVYAAFNIFPNFNLETLKVSVLHLAIVFTPTVLILLASYIQFSNVEGVSIGVAPGYVWEYFQKNIIGAIISAILFPLIVILLYPKKAFGSPYIVFPWIYYLVSLFIFYVFFEEGSRAMHANFVWGYVVGVKILFLFSFVTFYRLNAKPTKFSYLKASIGYSILFSHFVVGFYYWMNIVTGGNCMAL